MRTLRSALALLLLSSLCCGQEWTRFRGPNGTGIADGNLPATWNHDDYNWTVDLPGIGHSSPVIWGNRLFIQSADPDNGTQFTICLNTNDGIEIWRKAYPSKTYHIHTRNSFATSTPAVDEEHVYVAWATPDRIHLVCLTQDGEPVWSRDDMGPYESQHGFGSSPIVVGDLVILPNLQKPSIERGAETSAVYAFDKSSGELKWTTPRTSGKASYSVPCVREVNGKQELLLCSTVHGMFGLDVETGKENWAVKDAFKMRTVSSPLIVGDIVFGSTGSGAGGNYVAAVDLNEKSVKYTIKRQAPYVPTSVSHGDLVFLWYDKGFVSCIDAPTGKVHYTERLRSGFSGSPVRVGDKVYCIAEDGTVFVIAASEEYKLLGTVSLGEDSRSTPAVADGTIYLRTNSKLFSLGG